MTKELLSAIRESYGRLVYTHKTYEKAADICECKANRIKLINIFLLAITSGTAVGAIFKPYLLAIITPIISTIALFSAIFELSSNYYPQCQGFKRTATKLWLLREQYQNLIADIKSNNIKDKDISKKRDKLLDKLNDVLNDAPQTNPKAYKLAQQSLKIGKEYSFTSKEIDTFLPKELREN